ncbi:MAG: polysaccharide biosynthesis protein [Bacteroidales bacterium]|nr:polysaccharide biosynthesis protein [Bacteroidales bacterium]
MIPKIIHYVWLSNEPKDAIIKDYMDSWLLRNPGYTVKCWNTENFDININKFVFDSVKIKKWAFASDYIRMYALYTDGGIYLDSDVLVNKSFDDYLNFNFFSAVEYHPEVVQNEVMSKFIDENGNPINTVDGVPGIGIQAAIMGAEKGCQFAKDCLDWYDSHSEIVEDKTYGKLIAPGLYAYLAEKYGFKYKDEQQILKLSEDKTLLIEPSKVFCTVGHETDESIAVHMCNGSWRPTYKKKTFTQNLYDNLLRIYHKMFRK